MSPRDVRGLLPPEPIEIILDAVDEGASGQRLSFVLPHFPGPLLPMLRDRGVRFDSEMLPDMSGVIFHVDIP